MKLSLKLEDQQQQQTPILFKAKIPITVFGLPFLSAVSATHHHHSPPSEKLSLSLRTFFSSGPSLKLSYNTTTATAVTAAPFTVTLKSSVNLFGSPNNSPLIISANFSFSPQNPNPNFIIQFKPRIGSFSFRKSITSTVSNKKHSNGTDAGENSYGFVPLDRPNIWKELRVESDAKGSIFSGILVAADTELPVTKRIKVNLRWGVGMGVPSDYDKQLPYLRVKKIKVERIYDVIEENSGRKQGIEGDLGEFGTLKGVYGWMYRELNNLRKENREMRRALDDSKSCRNGGGKRVPGVENSDGFERWRMKKKANEQREMKNNGSETNVQSELQKAIKAASSSQ